jgi:feruloyl esterase
LVRLTDLNYAIEPGYVVTETDTMPTYCHVRGVINRAIRFEVTLPLKGWNGRFMFSTVGGFAGTIGDVTSLLSSGYAMASTDTGHEISEGNSFLNQPEALLDYSYRGVHLATQAAKSIIQTYYGEVINFSYLSGCSNGGRAALMEVTRFPADYDGVLAGAPLQSFSEFMPWGIHVARAMQANPLTVESLNVLAKNSASACDLLDGVADGVINDPRLCTENLLTLDGLACGRGKKTDCLTKGQIETAKLIYRPLKDKGGNVVAPGVMPGAESSGDWAFWILPNDFVGGGSPVELQFDAVSRIMRHHPSFDIDKFDPANDVSLIERELLPLNADDPDLSEFRANGGKLIVYQGWNDFPLRPQRAIDHLRQVEAAVEGQADDFYRLFMVSGMTHCRGGPGAWQTDYVKPLVDWREKGLAPDRIVGTQTGRNPSMPHLAPNSNSQMGKTFSRPQCVYPKLAAYDGSGDKGDAANYLCR